MQAMSNTIEAFSRCYERNWQILAHANGDAAIDLLALGLDPARATLFIQSRVPEHAELALLLGMITPVGWLERVPTYKERLRDLAEPPRHAGRVVGERHVPQRAGVRRPAGAVHGDRFEADHHVGDARLRGRMVRHAPRHCHRTDVDMPGDNALAHARLAAQQHVGVGPRADFDQPPDAADGRRAADDHLGGFAAEARAGPSPTS